MESEVRKTSPLRYAVGMFGTSIPINMFKTYAAIYYVDKLGLSMASYSLVLFIYTFIDALDLAVGFIPLCFANSLITAVLSSVLVGLGFAGAISTMDLIGARIIDEDSRKYGLRREGIYSSAMGFVN